MLCTGPATAGPAVVIRPSDIGRRWVTLSFRHARAVRSAHDALRADRDRHCDPGPSRSVVPGAFNHAGWMGAPGTRDAGEPRWSISPDAIPNSPSGLPAPSTASAARPRFSRHDRGHRLHPRLRPCWIASDALQSVTRAVTRALCVIRAPVNTETPIFTVVLALVPAPSAFPDHAAATPAPTRPSPPIPGSEMQRSPA